MLAYILNKMPTSDLMRLMMQSVAQSIGIINTVILVAILS